MSGAGLLAVGVAAMAASAAQTISGFGMNLILAPVAQVVVPGVAAPALAATVALAPLASGTGSRILSDIVAAVAAVISAVFLRLPQKLTGLTGALVAGILSGALNVSSGVSGPPVAAYAAAQPRELRRLVMTVQAVFLPMNVAAFIALKAGPTARQHRHCRCGRRWRRSAGGQSAPQQGLTSARPVRRACCRGGGSDHHLGAIAEVTRDRAGVHLPLPARPARA